MDMKTDMKGTNVTSKFVIHDMFNNRWLSEIENEDGEKLYVWKNLILDAKIFDDYNYATHIICFDPAFAQLMVTVEGGTAVEVNKYFIVPQFINHKNI